MQNSPAQQIKEKLDLVQTLKSYLDLQPAGRNFKALCPFHNEKSPSFMISPDRGTWHCFGCGLGGDIFTFVMKYDNLEFGEALKILAEKAGVELRRISPQEYKQFGLLYDINVAAKEFFRTGLRQASPAQNYLSDRGLSSETSEEFELGWAPNAMDDLSLYLLNAGFDSADIMRAGLTFKNQRGLIMDRFRGRIMFPIHNHLGKIVGFTGRILPQLDKGDMGKYINSPETPIFQKSKLLYGFWKSKNHIREAGSAFLVEGQMDFLMAWQSGLKSVIATSGTALTATHLLGLRRVSDQLILSFDSDEAGLNALERAIDLAESVDFGVRVAKLGKYKDPAEAVAAEPDFLSGAVEGAVPAPRFYFDRYLPEATDLKNRSHLAKLRLVLGKLNHMASSVERELWMKELAARTGVSLETLEKEASAVADSAMESKNSDSRKNEQASEVEDGKFAAKKMTRLEALSAHFLSALVMTKDFTDHEDVVFYLPEVYKDIFEILKRGERQSANPSKDELLNSIFLAPVGISDKEKQALKNQIRSEYLRLRREDLVEAVRQAERQGDDSALQESLKALSELPSK